MNTDEIDNEEIVKLKEKINQLEEEITMLQKEVVSNSKLRLSTVVDDDAKIAFYTGFPSYDHLKICFDFLGPAALMLQYRHSKKILCQSNKGRPRCLSH